MGKAYGNAKRARKLARLFDKWRQAVEAQDLAMMMIARRAIDKAIRDDNSTVHNHGG